MHTLNHTSPLRFARRRHFCSLLVVLGAATVFGQLMVNAPTTNFKLPLFNDQGYRHWYMKGEEALYVNESEVRINGLELEQYSGDEDDAQIGLLKSPQAIFYLDKQTATGPGAIEVETETFHIEGRDWIWQAEDNRIIINQDVKVVIFDSIGNIIR